MRYIALLRGVNVSGKNKLPMKELVSFLTSEDLQEVQYYVQSGNLVFHSQKPANHVKEIIQGCLLNHFSIDTEVWIKTEEEWEEVMKGNPYSLDDADPRQIHVVFFAAPITSQMIASLSIPATGDDTYTWGEDVLYLYTPGGYGKTKLNSNQWERWLKAPATARNWNTVRKLHDLHKNR